MEDLEQMAKSVRSVRNNIVEYDLGDRKVNVLAEGRLVNLAAGDGHPAEVMDLSFADQALCVQFISEHKLENGVHPVPLELDMSVARMKLDTMGIKWDTLTAEQTEYMNSWSSGT
jgi:adenosylhomocysteinase